MEINTVEDIFKAHDEFARQVDELGSRIGADATTDEAGFREMSLGLQEDLLSQRRQQLDALIAARERAIHRYDEEIARHQALVAALEDEVKASKRALPINAAAEPPAAGGRKRGQRG